MAMVNCCGICVIDKQKAESQHSKYVILILLHTVFHQTQQILTWKQNSALYCHIMWFMVSYPTTAGLCLVKSALIGHNVFHLSHWRGRGVKV